MHTCSPSAEWKLEDAWHLLTSQYSGIGERQAQGETLSQKSKVERKCRRHLISIFSLHMCTHMYHTRTKDVIFSLYICTHIHISHTRVEGT